MRAPWIAVTHVQRSNRYVNWEGKLFIGALFARSVSHEQSSGCACSSASFSFFRSILHVVRSKQKIVGYVQSWSLPIQYNAYFN
jgi:hypothetical protein